MASCSTSLHSLYLGVGARHLVGDAEWVLVATGRFDLPRLHELATRYAASFGVELPDEEPLLFLANLDEELWARSSGPRCGRRHLPRQNSSRCTAPVSTPAPSGSGDLALPLRAGALCNVP